MQRKNTITEKTSPSKPKTPDKSNISRSGIKNVPTRGEFAGLTQKYAKHRRAKDERQERIELWDLRGC
jgi:hypothetical protein